MLKKQVLLPLLIICMVTVNADVYMQSIRGGNNRLDEANRERNNGNRLFDSQNNDRGGYNVGKLNFYTGEEIPISWTLQHGCGTDDVKHCEVIIQGMCDPMARDGTTTQRIPDNPANCRNFNCDTDVKFGRHESYQWYQDCKATERNMGLFQASQQPNRADATRTRQNPGGTRRGYECPEERDYYPYWRPTPWFDIAIFTKDTEKCQAYQQESENVKSRFYCNVPQVVKDANNFGNGIGKTPNNYDACMALAPATNDAGNTTVAEWVEVPPNGMPEPVCLQSEASRPNHLGLIGNQKQWTYMWTVPDAMLNNGDAERACVFRLRYNITEDYDGSAADPTTGAFNTLDPGAVTAQYNRKSGGGNANNRPSTLPIWEKYGITGDEVGLQDDGTIENANDNDLGDNRDYRLRNNPRPDVLGVNFQGDYRLRLRLAVNTAQYGRTFQDRSHMTYIMQKPDNIPAEARLKLVTVAGKRGNIVQTFPGTEYFFWPEKLHVRKGDYVHFGWSGSDTNPNNNDGQGKQGTDRSNIVPLKNSNYPGNTELAYAPGTTTNNYGSLGNSYPAYVTKPELYELRAENLVNFPAQIGDHVQVPMAGFDTETLAALATLRREPGAKADRGNMEELDDAGTSFQMVPVQAKETGCWSYVSTRNNNFSNRSQKGTLCVDEGEYDESDVGPSGAAVSSGNGWIMIPTGTLNTIQTFRYRSEPTEEAVSDNVEITPYNMGEFMNEGQKVELGIQYEQRTLSTPVMEHRMSGDDSWAEVTDAEYKENDGGDTVAVAWVDQGGWYRVADKPNVGAIVAIVFSALVFMGVIGFMVWYKFWRVPSKSDEYNVNDTVI